MMKAKLFLLAACAWGVAQAAFQEVEWVEATGAQWINTRYVPACTDRFEMKVAVRATDATCALWCSRGATTTTNTLTCFAMNPARLRCGDGGVRPLREGDGRVLPRPRQGGACRGRRG